jgi:hypothetical protein
MEKTAILLSVMRLAHPNSTPSITGIAPQWVVSLLLVLAISLGQGPWMHAHQFDHHEPHEGRTILLKATVADHSHVNGVHSVLDFSHKDHHGAEFGGWKIVSEFLLKVAISILATVFVYAAWSMVFGMVSARTVFRLSEKVRSPPLLFHLSRPTRAPPQ